MTYTQSEILADLATPALRLATLRAWVLPVEFKTKVATTGFCSSLGSGSGASDEEMKALLDAFLVQRKLRRCAKLRRSSRGR